MGDWTFFSNYGHVLVCLARNRDARLRDVAEEVGLTERAVQKIVRDLQEADYLTVTKQGRCNRYRINRRKALRHALESHCTVGKLLGLVAKPGRHDEFAGTEPPAAPERAEPRAEARQEPAADAGVERETTETDDTKRAESKADKGKKPPDTRQQGSLF
jgi:Mn-dependent DtxR family transcriptional regulator